MFLFLLLAVVLGATVRFLRLPDRAPPEAGAVLLRWLLVGYCGLPMVLVAILVLVHPHEAAEALGFEPDHPFALFLGWAYLGMAVSATLAFRMGDSYLVGPGVTWAIFFFGATFVHVGEAGGMGAAGHGGLLRILATHGSVSALLVVGLALRGRDPARAAPPPSSAD